jgi:hypothetical protein
LKEQIGQHKKLLIAVLVLVVLLVLYLITKKSEKFTQFAVDMAAARNPDPTLFKYTGRLRAPSGLDEYDNYYENKMLWQQGVADRLEGFPAFQPRVDPTWPTLIPRARTGLESKQRNDTFRYSELGWAEARKLLQEDPAQGGIITRAQIEAKAVSAEEDAYAEATRGDATPQ